MAADSTLEEIASLLSQLGSQLIETLPRRSPQIPKLQQQLSQHQLLQHIAEVGSFKPDSEQRQELI